MYFRSQPSHEHKWRTWTACRRAPVFLVSDETLQPGKSSSGFTSESELEIGGYTGTQHGLGQSRGMAMYLKDR